MKKRKEGRMKKYFYLILIIIFTLTSFGYSQSITVTNPHSGQVWNKGNTYTIIWTKSGSMDSQVKITLYKPDHTTLQTIIAKPTANDGSYDWTIPDSIPNGQYIVRVKTMDNAVYGESDTFSIKTSSFLRHFKLEIPITSPKSGETYLEGNNVNIVWNNVLTKGKTVRIYARDGLNNHDYLLFTLTCDKTAKHQMIGWRIPKDFIKEHNIKRKRYRIYIECQINSRVFKGLSEEFTVKKRSGESLKLFPSCVNQVKQYSDYSECGQFIQQLTPYPTNAHNIVVAGFHGWYESYHCRNAYVYRGKAYFDLVSFIKFHKYLYNGGYRFQKATLKIMNTNKKCPLIIHVIKNDNSDLFKVQLGDKVNHNGSKANITSVVRKWLIFPSKNKGLLFMGNDEKGLYNNYYAPCVMQVQLTLTLEYIRL